MIGNCTPSSMPINAYTKGDTESALLYYMLAAEHGYEVAQSNVAFLLDRGTPCGEKRLSSLCDRLFHKPGFL